MAKKNSAKRLARLERRRLRRQLKRHRQAANKRVRWCAELADVPGGYNRHHRLPKSRHGSNSKSNISVVPIRSHQAYNAIFGGNPTAQEVVQQLNERWIDPAYEIVFTAVPKEEGGVSWPIPVEPVTVVSTSPPPSSVLTVRKSMTCSNGHVRVSYSPRIAYASNCYWRSTP